MPRSLFTPGKDPVPICIGGWVGPRTGLDRCGISRPAPGFDPQTVQLRSQSLYRLSYRAHTVYKILWKKVEWDRSQMKIWRRRIACWISSATNTHSGCVIYRV